MRSGPGSSPSRTGTAVAADDAGTLTGDATGAEPFRSAFDSAAIGMALIALDSGRWMRVNRPCASSSATARTSSRRSRGGT